MVIDFWDIYQHLPCSFQLLKVNQVPFVPHSYVEALTFGDLAFREEIKIKGGDNRGTLMWWEPWPYKGGRVTRLVGAGGGGSENSVAEAVIAKGRDSEFHSQNHRKRGRDIKNWRCPYPVCSLFSHVWKGVRVRTEPDVRYKHVRKEASPEKASTNCKLILDF